MGDGAGRRTSARRHGGDGGDRRGSPTDAPATGDRTRDPATDAATDPATDPTPRASHHRAGRLRRVLADAPRRLVAFSLVALALAVALTWTLGVDPPPQRDTDLPPGARLEADPVGERALVVVTAEQPTAEVLAAIGRLTDRIAALPGVTGAASIANTPVVMKTDRLDVATSPVTGTGAAMALEPEVAVLWAARSRTGTAGLVAPDGRTYLVAATLDPAADRGAVLAAVRAATDDEVRGAGGAITAGFGGSSFLQDAEEARARRQLLALALLAVVVPTGLVLVVFRRRASATTTLLASGASLLVVATLLASSPRAGGWVGSSLPADDPAVVATAAIDERLHGSVPVELELLGAPGTFRRPEVLAQLDALTSWLEDVHDVHVAGMPGTLRDAAGVLTGVDSVPPSAQDVDRLLTELGGGPLAGGSSSADPGTAASILRTYVSPDHSRAVLIGFTPDRGPDQLGRVAANVDYVSGRVLEDTGIVAHLTAGAPPPGSVEDLLARAVGVLGLALVAFGIVSALLSSWARRHPEDTIDLRDEPEPDAAPPRLFAREDAQSLP